MKENMRSYGLLIAMILIILFGVSLFLLNKLGYVSFNFNKEQLLPPNEQVKSDTTEETVDDATTTNNNKLFKMASTNMTNDEVFDLWNKIKGNWAIVEYNNEFCSGRALEINYFIQFKKFNSDGITNWSIVSYNKINDNKYEVNLMTPVDLINNMSGDIVAHYSTITVDITKLSDKVLRIYNGDSYTDYRYVGENKGEIKNFNYIDGGFSQDFYCNWYKNN